MKSARHSSAQSDARKVVHLDRYRPPITATQLINETRRLNPASAASLPETVRCLPDVLTLVLDQVLREFDYRRNCTAPMAITCVLLASAIGQLSGGLEELQ